MNRNDAIFYNQGQENTLSDMDFCHLQVNIENIIGHRTRCSKKYFQTSILKAAEAAGECIGNEIADKTVKPKLVIYKNLRNVEELSIPPRKKTNIKPIKTSIRRIAH